MQAITARQAASVTETDDRDYNTITGTAGTGQNYLEKRKQLTESVTEPDEKQSLWLITDKGKETLKNPPAEWFISLAETPPKTPSGTPPEPQPVATTASNTRRSKETLANLKGNPETATLLQHGSWSAPQPLSTPEEAMSLLD